jgi:hypothetical protein
MQYLPPPSSHLLLLLLALLLISLPSGLLIHISEKIEHMLLYFVAFRGTTLHPKHEPQKSITAITADAHYVSKLQLRSQAIEKRLVKEFLEQRIAHSRLNPLNVLLCEIASEKRSTVT